MNTRAIGGVLLLLINFAPARAATFEIADGDVAALKSAIATANTNGEGDTINLAEGGTYVLSAVDNTGTGPNGLPSIGADFGDLVVINGNGATITRSTASGTPEFRILQVLDGAVVRINEATLSNGRLDPDQSSSGGGIYSGNARLTLVACTLRDNFITGTDTAGGAIHNNSGTLTLRRCTFSGNLAIAAAASISASSYGGAIFNRNGTLAVQLCTFSVNTATATHSEAFQDSEGYGGAISSLGYNPGVASLTITSSTFASNRGEGSSGSNGAAIYVAGDASTAVIGSTIFANTPSNLPLLMAENGGAITSRGYNLSDDGGSGFLTATGDQINTSAQLRALAENGGPTQTHAIEATSPAVDKGKRNAVESLPVSTDQRGVARPFDYPGIPAAPGGDASDIGAFEISGLPQSGPTFIVNATSDHTDTVCSTEDCTLREAIAAANEQPGDNTIVFAGGVTGAIELRGALPDVSTNMVIRGPGANVLHVRRNTGGDYRIFAISNGSTSGPIVTISGLTVSNGQATGSAAPGGGIDNAYGLLTLDRCVITANAGGNGAGIYNLGGTLTIRQSTVSDNNATGFGGGIFNNSSASATATLAILNSTIAGNTAGRGAAIHNSGTAGVATTSLRNCTLSGNSSLFGTIFNTGASAALFLRNTILNAGASGATFLTSDGATVTSQGNNISSDAAGGDNSTAPGGFLNQPGDRRNTDPMLDPLGLRDNGGPTPTLALRPGSPAIDGDADDDTNAPPRDQRGFVRADLPDVGAFEFKGTLPVTLANISTRLRVETGDNVLIGGFIITGSQPKKVLVRGLGPSLDVDGKLANPQLEIFRQEVRIATNDNWKQAPNRQAIIDTKIPPPRDLESAVLRTLDPGIYTAVLRGASGGTGIGLVEVYDLDRTVNAKLANISTRGVVQTDDDVMIGGFIVLGVQSQKVIVRAIGPSLPVSGRLGNPVLELRDRNGVLLQSNNNWRSNQEAEIIATGVPPSNDLECAIVRTLPPAPYTAIVRGVNNTTGVALVEVYAID